MKQRYTFIIFFIMLFMYHCAFCCPTCLVAQEKHPTLWKNKIYIPITRDSTKAQTDLGIQS